MAQGGCSETRLEPFNSDGRFVRPEQCCARALHTICSGEGHSMLCFYKKGQRPLGARRLVYLDV